MLITAVFSNSRQLMQFIRVNSNTFLCLTGPIIRVEEKFNIERVWFSARILQFRIVTFWSLLILPFTLSAHREFIGVEHRIDHMVEILFVEHGACFPEARSESAIVLRPFRQSSSFLFNH